MSIFEEAENIVSGERQDWYDHPLDNFTRIAKIWSVILGTEVHWSKVALCMDATKISRETFRPKHDNRVDGIGYWGALDIAYEEEARRNAAEAAHRFESPRWEQLEIPFE